MGVGLDVTGAFLGRGWRWWAWGWCCGWPWARSCPGASDGEGAGLRDLLAHRGFRWSGLTLLFLLQEVHVIVVKHEASSDAAGSYAVAAVAAKG